MRLWTLRILLTTSLLALSSASVYAASVSQLQQKETQYQQQLTQAQLQEQATQNSIDQVQQQAQQAQQQLQQAHQQFQQAQQLLATAQAQRSSLTNAQAQSTTHLVQAETHALAMSKVITTLQTLIQQSTSQLAALQQSHQHMTQLYQQTHHRQVLTQQAQQHTQQILNVQLDFVEEHGPIGYLSVLLGTHSFTQFVGRTEILAQILGQTHSIIQHLTLQQHQQQNEAKHLLKEIALIQQTQQTIQQHHTLLNQEETTLQHTVSATQQQVAASQNAYSQATTALQHNNALAQQAAAQTTNTQNTITSASNTLGASQQKLSQLQHQQAQITQNITALGSQIQQIANQIQSSITQYNQGSLTQNGLYQSLYPLVAPIAAQDGLSPDLVLGVITEESGGNASIVSPAGAVGLMQLEPGTAEYLGVNPAELTDPQVNLVAGCLYLKDMLGLFQGNISLALSAYNAGPGAVEKNNNQVLPYTTGYVANIEALMARYAQMG